MTDKIEYEIIDSDASAAIVTNYASVEHYFATLKTGTGFLLTGCNTYPALCFVDVTATPAIVHLIDASKTFNAMRKCIKGFAIILEGAAESDALPIEHVYPPLIYSPTHGNRLDFEISADEFRTTNEKWLYNPWTGIPRTENAVLLDPFGLGFKPWNK